MDSSDILTLITAILGSGALATLIQLTANRFRIDRRADLIRSWKEESDIADKLYKEAISIDAGPGQKSHPSANNNSSDGATRNEQPSEKTTQDQDSPPLDPEFASRNSRIAFSRAVRSDLNKRLSLELVPSNAIGIVFSYLIALAFSLGGLFLVVTGTYLIATAGDKDTNPPASAGVLVIIYGVIFMISGIVMFSFLNAVEQSRMRARKIILDVLNIDSPGSSGKIKIENDDLMFVDELPKLFTKTPKFRRNKAPRPTLLRRALGKDLAYNLETFIRQTTTKDTFESPKSATNRKTNTP